VFVVGYLGDWRRAAAVLFERESLSGNPAPSREKRESVADSTIPSIAGSLDTECGGGKLTHQSAVNGHIVPTKPTWWDGSDFARTITTKSDDQRMPDKDNAQLVMQPIAFTTEQTPKASHDKAFTITKGSPTGGGHPQAVMHPMVVHGTQDPCVSDIAFAQGRNNGGENVLMQPMAVCLGGQHPNAAIGIDKSPTLTNAMGAGGGHVPITNAMAVRRLTPKECERLQGFPDFYTDIMSKGKATPDGPRYKALGNSMAVPVMAWIGKRIQEVDAICKPNK
jgi:DNA (cytosine-5)-methyltransferase 1